MSVKLRAKQRQNYLFNPANTITEVKTMHIDPAKAT